MLPSANCRSHRISVVGDRPLRALGRPSGRERGRSTPEGAGLRPATAARTVSTTSAVPASRGRTATAPAATARVVYSKDGNSYYIVDGHTHFAASFDADGLDPDLVELRVTFERKAHLAAQERLARALVTAGADPASLAGPVAEAAARAPAETAGVARRRERLGLSSGFALCDDQGAALAGEQLPGWLRFARTVRVSIEGNAGFCRGLLETRYGLARTG